METFASIATTATATITQIATIDAIIGTSVHHYRPTKRQKVSFLPDPCGRCQCANHECDTTVAWGTTRSDLGIDTIQSISGYVTHRGGITATIVNNRINIIVQPHQKQQQQQQQSFRLAKVILCQIGGIAIGIVRLYGLDRCTDATTQTQETTTTLSSNTLITGWTNHHLLGHVVQYVRSNERIHVQIDRLGVCSGGAPTTAGLSRRGLWTQGDRNGRR